MDENLPDEFEVIIVGTGLTESILSGALSRIGKKVLHLDAGDHYGGSWSSFNLKSFEEHLQIPKTGLDNFPTPHHVLENMGKNLSPNETFIPITSVRRMIQDVEFKCFLSDPEFNPSPSKNKVLEDEKEPEVIEKDLDSGDGNENPSAAITSQESEDNELKDHQNESDQNHPKDESDENHPKDEVDDPPKDVEKKSEEEKKSLAENKLNEAKKDFNKETFYNEWRRFNLDLSPKLMFSRGKLVELLIQSNVCRYLEFRNVSRTLTFLDHGSEEILAPVPCSRSDVFSSKFVSVIEKRMLMRVLTVCANFEKHPQEYKDFEDKPFVDFLTAKKMSKKLQHFMLHSISMVDQNCNTMDGLYATKKFLLSLGRYGNSAFLWPMYGVGELPQAFCRLSAVFGGTYCLKRSVAGIVMQKDDDTNNCVAIIDTTGQRLSCSHLVIDECYVPNAQRSEFKDHIARAIYVTNKSILEADSEKVTLITVPSTKTRPASKVIELGPSSCVCPKNCYVVHAMSFMSNKITSVHENFTATEDMLFNISSEEDNQKPRILWSSYFKMSSGGANVQDLPSNVYVTNGPNTDLGFDQTVTEAEALFNKICPEEEFLPRAPNPEEIIYQDDEGYNTEHNEEFPHQDGDNNDDYTEAVEDIDLQQESSSESLSQSAQENTDSNSRQTGQEEATLTESIEEYKVDNKSEGSEVITGDIKGTRTVKDIN